MTSFPKRWMKKSLGIGLPISQIAGIYFPTEIDTYCKTVMQCHGYDVYMDDRIIIHPDKKHTLPIQDGLRDAGFNMDNAHVFASLSEATTWLQGFMRPGDYVLYENDLPDHYTEN